MKKRSEVDIRETWKLEDLFADDKAFFAEVEDLLGLSQKLKAYEDFSSKEGIKEGLDLYNDLLGRLIRAENFASISTEVDATDMAVAKRYASFVGKSSEILVALSTFELKLSKADPDFLRALASDDPRDEYFFERALERGKRAGSLEREEALSKLQETFDRPYEEYSTLRYQDMAFEKLEVSGKEVELNHNLFEEYLEGEEDTDLRREAFASYHKSLASCQYANGAIYGTQVRNEKILAGLYGFDSVTDYLLFGQDVPREVYEKELDTIMTDLAPHMRKYAGIVERVYGLDRMTYADLKLSIYEKEGDLPIEEAENYILKGLSNLGEDYLDFLKRAFSERWIDYAQNEGKRTGAFAADPYLSHPFVMTTYNRQMSQVMTLAHELGHCGQFLYTDKAQRPMNSEMPMYFSEAPSTANEITMERYLLKEAKTDEDRLFVLSTMISKTYYHNFVTHFMEASFQREVYNRIDEGESLGAEDFNQIFLGELKKFWGDAVDLLPGAELTWMRQPHYYMGLYPYTYAAGLTVGTLMSEKIVHGGEADRDKWLEVLSLGSSKSPIDLAKAAGIDMTSTEPLKEVIAFIGEIIDEMDELCKKLGLYKK